MMNFSNAQIAEMLRQVAAALTIKKANLFQIRAYDNAADSIEHSTSEAQDLWEQGQLDQIPGVGESLQEHLNELFKTGQVKHWEELKKGIPNGTFELLGITGVGPKTALKLAQMGIKNRKELAQHLKRGELIEKGISQKLAQKIEQGLNEASVNTGRMLLPYAFAQSEKIIEYIKSCKDVKEVNNLGSLRRRVATIGDLDFSISSDKPEKVVKHLINMPGVSRVLGEGETKVTLMLNSGLHLDFLISHPDSYGALLQHFTGSKNHNIKLRTLAEKRGYSLSEYGVRRVKGNKRSSKNTQVDDKLIKCKTEEDLYKLLGMQTPEPELREEAGEIEAALKKSLPKLIQLKDIKGDLHMHSNYPGKPSHDLGADSIEQMAKTAKDLGYQYIGISDHNPSPNMQTQKEYYSLVKGRSEFIGEINSPNKFPRILNLLEVDIQADGMLAIPDDSSLLLDFIIGGVHSLHRSNKDKMTQRLLKALEHPKLKILAHPTGRLLNERDSYDADWESIFKVCVEKKIALEINAYPNRLDLPDLLARRAKELGVKFVINTDSHKKESLENMQFGIFVARRAWLEKEDVINSWPLQKMLNWFGLKQ